MKEEHGSSSTSLHAHGDGSFHTHSPARSCNGDCAESGRGGIDYYGSGGKRKDHESIGAALMHMAMKHSDGDHMHIEGHDSGFTTHHVMEGKRVQGPSEHKSVGELKRHVAEVMDTDEDGE
jgi:hypothetical protein